MPDDETPPPTLAQTLRQARQDDLRYAGQYDRMAAAAEGWFLARLTAHPPVTVGLRGVLYCDTCTTGAEFTPWTPEHALGKAPA